MSTRLFDCVVVGGGISGLAAAHALHRAGRDVIVLERQVRCGGYACSERLPGGFLMEHGPSTVANEAGAAVSLASGLGLDGQRRDLGPEVKRRYLVKNRSLSGIPLHPLGLLTASYLSPMAKMRLLAEILVPRARPDGEPETVSAFCRRRFGAEVTEALIDPLVAGIYAGRAEVLEVNAVFPRLADMERRHGGVIRAILSGGRRRRMPGSRLFSWTDGIGALPSALVRALEGRIRTGTMVRKLNNHPDGWALGLGPAGVIRARTVILAVQPHVAAGLLEDIDPEAAAALGVIPAPPLAVAFLGYPRGAVEHPLDSLGFLVPKREGRAVNGAQFSSTMFPSRAPRGQVALTFYLGGARNPSLARLAAPEILDLACSEAKDLLGATGAPTLTRVRHWPRGLPQYTIGHGARLESLSGITARRHGLYLTGNYFQGPSVGACVTHARDVAAAVDRALNLTMTAGAGRNPTPISAG